MDKPRGFFKLAITTLTEIIQNIQSTSILSHSSVHPGINQLLRCIYRNLKNWRYLDNGKLDMEWISDQEPYLFESTQEILEFINIIASKVNDEVYLVKVFFTQTASVDDEISERMCFPFQILVLYFKAQKNFLSITDKGILRTVILKCLNCMSKDETFAEYVSNESEFIEIFMQILASQLENLPHTLQYCERDGFNVIEQIEGQYNKLIVDQFKDFIDSVYFLREILQNIHNEHISMLRIKHQPAKHSNAPSRKNSSGKLPILENQSQLESRHELKVKESFQISFFSLILCKIIQPLLLDESLLQKARTLMQYLIEILVILNDPTISRLIYAFYFDKLEALRNQYIVGGQNQNLYQQIIGLETTTFKEYKISTNEFSSDHLSEAGFEQVTTQYDDENMIDYENNNKKRPIVPRLNLAYNSSFGNYSKESVRKLRQSNDFSVRVPQSPEMSVKSSSNPFNIKMVRSQQKNEEFNRRTKIQYPNDKMTEIRLNRIDLLLQEAQDIQDIQSERESFYNMNKFANKLDRQLLEYNGHEMLRYSKINLKRDNEGINLVYLQMIHSIIKIQGIRQFYMEFMVDDMILIEEENQPIKDLQDFIGSTLTYLTATDLDKEILLHLIDDSETMFESGDTMTLVVFIIQYGEGSILDILEKLKSQVAQFQDNSDVKIFKKTIQSGFEIVSDGLQQNNSNWERNMQVAENILIFENLYQQFQLFLIHHLTAFKIIQDYHTVKKLDRKIRNSKQITQSSI
ncbi:UNKNOWN [Stylonychia lemnae]|uniref:Uncharacterized protein n=1 Tax=Stylonychia lemnae TaxID=5949 RepID=A0A077ZWS2_STYLE|nr:UNKNOWN [Stylonychia lemnae]|eukprot:CDW72941.1 UNKNOWN [Stylonychia lemnae]